MSHEVRRHTAIQFGDENFFMGARSIARSQQSVFHWKLTAYCSYTQTRTLNQHCYIQIEGPYIWYAELSKHHYIEAAMFLATKIRMRHELRPCWWRYVVCFTAEIFGYILFEKIVMLWNAVVQRRSGWHWTTAKIIVMVARQSSEYDSPEPNPNSPSTTHEMASPSHRVASLSRVKTRRVKSDKSSSSCMSCTSGKNYCQENLISSPTRQLLEIWTNTPIDRQTVCR